MMRNWKILALVTLAALAFQARAVHAQASGPAETGDKVLDQIKKMEKNLLDQMEGSFRNVERDMAKVKKDINELKDSLNGKILAQSVFMDATDKRVETLEIQIKNLNRLIKDLEAKLPATNYVAKSPPPSTGRVIFANQYSEDMVFIINQKPYQVRANTTLPIEGVPAGNLTYEVVSPTWGSRGINARTLPPGETLTLTAR